jgi:hypothetical protein
MRPECPTGLSVGDRKSRNPALALSRLLPVRLLAMPKEFRDRRIKTVSREAEYNPMTHLFDPLTIRDITFTNRVFVSPMCQYSSTDGYVSDWHSVHLGSRAVGGAGLVLYRSNCSSSRGSDQSAGLGHLDGRSH